MTGRKIIAWGHRGAMGYAPENTIISFCKAVDMGVDGIELDTFESQDGHMMVTHSDAVEVEGTRYRISKLPLDELKKVRMEGDHEIPTLDEVFERFEAECDNTLLYSIDVRDSRSFESYYQALERGGVLDRVYTCFDSRYAIKKMRRMHPELVMKVLSLKEGGQSAMNEIEKSDPEIVKVINLSSENLTPELINMIHENGQLSFVWDCNQEQTMKKFVGWGVDALYSDYPDLLVKVVKDHSS